MFYAFVRFLRVFRVKIFIASPYVERGETSAYNMNKHSSATLRVRIEILCTVLFGARADGCASTKAGALARVEDILRNMRSETPEFIYACPHLLHILSAQRHASHRSIACSSTAGCTLRVPGDSRRDVLLVYGGRVAGF